MKKVYLRSSNKNSKNHCRLNIKWNKMFWRLNIKPNQNQRKKNLVLLRNQPIPKRKQAKKGHGIIRILSIFFKKNNNNIFNHYSNPKIYFRRVLQKKTISKKPFSFCGGSDISPFKLAKKPNVFFQR